MKMRYVNMYGHKVSELTLGTAQLGLDYSIQNSFSRPDARQSFNILESALKAGINTLDTARTYGRSEKIIGDFKEEFLDEMPNIVTKFKINNKNLNDFDLARTEVYESINTSLSVLGVNCISICLFHQDNNQPMPLVMKVLPRILRSLIEDGLIGIGGVSVYRPDELRHILDHDIIKAVQAPMNIFDQRLKKSGLLEQLHRRQKLIFIRSVFLKGLFFVPVENLTGSLTAVGKYLETLHNLANRLGVSVAQLAFSYVRDMEEVTSIVVGADNVHQVQQNISFLQSKKLEPAICGAIEKQFDLPEFLITPHLWKT